MRRILFLTLAGGAALLAVLVALKPPIALPEYFIGYSDNKLVAQPVYPIDGSDLQAEGFYLDSTGVHLIQRSATIDRMGRVVLEVKTPSTATALGMVIGRAYSMPSATDAWEEKETEGPARPNFRVVTIELDRSSSGDRSDRRDR
jgi:hypothetical protein